MTFKGKTISLATSVTIKFRDKFKVRNMIESQQLLFNLMLKQGFNWFTLALKILKQKVFEIKLSLQKWHMKSVPLVTSSLGQSGKIYQQTQ